MTESPIVLAETPTWLVLYKPAGWHCVEAGGEGTSKGRKVARSKQATQNFRHSGQEESSTSNPADAAEDGPTVEHWLRSRFDAQRALPEAGLVHRLDVQTTGCLLVARDAESQQRLRSMMAEPTGAIRKFYLALVECPAADTPQRGEFRLYFSSRYRRSRKVTVRETGEARHLGVCEFSTRRRIGEHRRVLEVELIGPGRRHQIRAGLAHLGMSIVGDDLYGRRGDQHAPPDSPGPHLHAWRLVVEGTRVEAPPPAWAAVAPQPTPRNSANP